MPIDACTNHPSIASHLPARCLASTCSPPQESHLPGGDLFASRPNLRRLPIFAARRGPAEASHPDASARVLGCQAPYQFSGLKWILSQDATNVAPGLTTNGAKGREPNVAPGPGLATYPRDPSTFSEGTWALQAYMNSLQSPSEKVLGSLGVYSSFWGLKCILRARSNHRPTVDTVDGILAVILDRPARASASGRSVRWDMLQRKGPAKSSEQGGGQVSEKMEKNL